MGNRNSGRRPQPTLVKLLRGNPGLRRLNDREPQTLTGDVVKPAGLSVGAARLWDELAPLCLAMRTLTPGDAKAFGVLCEIQNSLDQVGALKDNGDWDTAMIIERQYAPLVRPYYDYFGMTATSRARMSVPKAKDEAPPRKWANLK
jgi:hypothetical protein